MLTHTMTGGYNPPHLPNNNLKLHNNYTITYIDLKILCINTKLTNTPTTIINQYIIYLVYDYTIPNIYYIHLFLQLVC